MATAIEIQPSTPISPADAIWALIQTQTKAVQKNLAKRFAAWDKAERERRKAKEYEATLSHEEKAWAQDIANSIDKGLQDVRLLEEGRLQNHENVFRPVDELFTELDEICNS